MEDELFSDMPSAPKAPKLPKHFPDLQGSLRGRTPEAGWYQNDFLPWIQITRSTWIQNEEVKNVLGYGIGIVLAFCLGALIQNEEVKNFLGYGIGIALVIGLGALMGTYQDEIQEEIKEKSCTLKICTTKAINRSTIG